jgi:hypothetical protein
VRNSRCALGASESPWASRILMTAEPDNFLHTLQKNIKTKDLASRWTSLWRGADAANRTDRPRSAAGKPSLDLASLSTPHTADAARRADR